MVDEVADINTGFFLARPTGIVKQVFTLTSQSFDRHEIDQYALNDITQNVLKIHFSKPFKALDKLLFPNGNIFFNLRLNDRLGTRPFVVHVNYAVGVDAKRERLINRNLWYL
jgi:hypothetical protein